MQHLDQLVVSKALHWSAAGRTVWLCTVLSTYGSAPRAPGSMLAATADGESVGSLSGGCVEEELLERLRAGAFPEPVCVLRYGDGSDPNSQVRLPCGGVLEVLVENLAPDCSVQVHLCELESALNGHQRLIREVSLAGAERRLLADNAHGAQVECQPSLVRIRVGAAQRLLLAGYSSVAHVCAQYALGLGFEVVLCDPREEVLAGVELAGVTIRRELPSEVIRKEGCHANTAVVALTHDPRIDDLAMIEAVRTEAFYIGVMGSRLTSAKRLERLHRVGGLDDNQLERVRAPIGLNLGSKTPAEIALAVLADIVRVRNAVPRDAL